MITPIMTENMLRIFGTEWFKSGSQVICNPPPEGSDHDYFVYCPWQKEGKFWEGLEMLGFESTLEYYGKMDDFLSWRQDDINVILVYDIDLFNKTKIATDLAKERNILDKKKRIQFFEDIRKGVRDETGEYVKRSAVRNWGNTSTTATYYTGPSTTSNISRWSTTFTSEF